MKKIILLLFTVSVCYKSYSQVSPLHSGTQIYYVNSNLGIGTDNPQALLHLVGGNDVSDYPTVTSRGDVFQLFRVSNNVFEFGLAGAVNARRAWILSRHSDTGGTYGMHYSTLHLQPDIGNKSYYKGVAIGYNASVTLPNNTHLAVNGHVGIGTTSPSSKLEVYETGGSTTSPNITLTLDYESDQTTKSGGGTAILFRGKSSGGNIANYDQARIRSVGYDTNNMHGLAFDFKKNASTPLSEGMRLSNQGYLGIGTTSPTQLLEVGSNTGTQGYIRLRSSGSVYEGNIFHTAEYSIYMDTNTNLRPIRIDGSALITGMTGNVGIGTTTPSEKLEVNGNALVQGNIESKKVRVTASPGNWPDYVFEESYKLQALSDLEKYIQAHKHLPEVPSAKEVETNGQDLGEIQATLLKKVEELTLYVIEQDRKQLSLEERLEKLEEENSKLKALLKK